MSPKRRRTALVIMGCESCGRYEAFATLDGCDLCARCGHAVLEHGAITVHDAHLVECDGACASRTRVRRRRRHRA